jgi:hypothetical protein
MPAKKLGVKLNWQDCVWPIIRALRDQANRVFVETIAEFAILTDDQADNCAKVLENLLSRLVFVLESAHLGDKMLIDSTTFTASSVQAATFHQAYAEFCDTGGEAAKDIFALKIDTGLRSPRKQASNKNMDGDGKDDYTESNAKLEAFLATNPSHQAKIKWALSDTCGAHQKRHIEVEALEPFSIETWTCRAHDCKGHVFEHSRRRQVPM